MKQFLCWLLSLSSFVSQAQNIVAAEYFIDNDPGVGNGTSVAVGVAGATVNFTASVSTTSLSQGFHFVSLRTKDQNGTWGLGEVRGFYVSQNTSNAGNIIAAEYFIDADPGLGNGTPITVGPPGADVNFVATVPTSSLSQGFHFLAIRTKDADGKWSLLEFRGFFISQSTTAAANIVAAEYFIDADPGAGNGTSLPVGGAGGEVNFIASVPTSSLSQGFHFLAIRVKDVDGKWGLFEARGFYISASTANAGAIVAAESFIDVDPGIGNGTPLNVGTPADSVGFIASVPTTSLSQGFHFLAIRTKNASGGWGLFEVRGFYVTQSATNMGNVTAAEYFIDSDPGVGNAAPLNFTTADTSVTQSFLLNVPAGTPNGQHLIAIRTRDANGIWGLFEVREFTVGGVLPLDWLAFTGKRIQQKVTLQWTTGNEINTSHFEIERSKNGIDFSSIGRTTAQGAVRNNYHFDDVQPLNGLNFYRLKQFDRNGAFKYSTIIKLFFAEGGKNDLKLFPQPVTSILNAVFGGSGNSLFIQIYDAAGKMVMNERKQNTSTITIGTNNLAKGSYWIVISDGVSQQKGMFVKQ